MAISPDRERNSRRKVLTWISAANAPKIKSAPPSNTGRKAELKFTSKDTRLSQRRAYEQTEEFKKRSATRSGVEATNSRFKRQTGFNRLRYRGKKKPRMSVIFKIIGVNFLRVIESLRPKNVAKATYRLIKDENSGFL
ncbi:MAG: transposase [Deltaproteobacteria bacterium]|nr:transposase [Deltaproteobacteria bacterium]